MVLAELIYNLRKLIKDSGSDDSQFSDRNLEFIISYLRSKLIRQDIQRYKRISPNIEQPLGVIELEIVDTSEDIDFETGTTILRSIKEIPTSIDVDGKSLITSISGLDNSNRIDLKPKVQAIKNRWSKYASKRPAAYLANNRIYITGCNKELTYITADGVFENPREVSNFKDKEGNTCYDIFKDHYPMPRHMIDMMNSLVKRQELDLYFQLIEDKINDGQNNA